MPIFLRNTTYHLRRRVPKRFAEVEERREFYASLKTDSLDLARQKAELVWQQQIELWEALDRGDESTAKARYEAAQRLAKASGLQFLSAPEVAKLPLKDIVARVEKSIGKDGEIDDRRGRAYLGAIDKPGLTMTECLDEFFLLSAEENEHRSANQMRVRNNNFKRAIGGFVEAVGNLEIQEIGVDHMIQLREFYGLKIRQGKVKAATANKELKNFGTVLRKVNRMKRLDLDLPVTGWSFKNATEDVRPPFTTDWIINTLVRGNALEDLNPEARGIVLLMINTGLRPSEAAGLRGEDIHLGGRVPYLEIKARSEGAHKRAVKTKSAERVIPLAGVSLDALRAFPRGFPRYFDKATISATVNKYLRERGVMESNKHTLYCLRHSFEDRMLEAGLDDRTRRDFLGHALDRERYGTGGTLEFRLEQIKLVAL